MALGRIGTKPKRLGRVNLDRRHCRRGRLRSIRNTGAFDLPRNLHVRHEQFANGRTHDHDRSRKVTGERPGLIKRLRRRDLPIDTVKLARFLIGKMLVHDLRGHRTSGRIVETEAYPVGDAAGHAFRGETKRNASLYLARGHAYVYFIYGMYCWLNVSSERA